MPAHRVRIDHEVLTSDIKFGLGMPFGGMTLAGTQNWFELLKAANVYSVRRKAQPGYNKINIKRRPISRASTFEEDHLTETKTIEKKTSEQTKVGSLTKPLAPIKPRIPVINIIKASNESIPDLCVSDSSDEESDCDEGDDLVYECPGLAASAEDMTVENPLFQEKHFQSSYRTPELAKKYWKDVFVESV
ncbi:Neural proliferation differentiation and control 1 [Paramuricea clavata]|uniref:Neural proliferation differentiation and control 1, partial n=1 Tax=Paramuricea clavata TaxID=317549 RepID=A0A6S7G425_PARCT|nr:Neural proliferation differentiation and control 1 [Paramuricea clavata]